MAILSTGPVNAGSPRVELLGELSGDGGVRFSSTGPAHVSVTTTLDKARTFVDSARRKLGHRTRRDCGVGGADGGRGYSVVLPIGTRINDGGMSFSCVPANPNGSDNAEPTQYLMMLWAPPAKRPDVVFLGSPDSAAAVVAMLASYVGLPNFEILAIEKSPAPTSSDSMGTFHAMSAGEDSIVMYLSTQPSVRTMASKEDASAYVKGALYALTYNLRSNECSFDPGFGGRPSSGIRVTVGCRDSIAGTPRRVALTVSSGKRPPALVVDSTRQIVQLLAIIARAAPGGPVPDSTVQRAEQAAAVSNDAFLASLEGVDLASEVYNEGDMGEPGPLPKKRAPKKPAPKPSPATHRKQP